MPKTDDLDLKQLAVRRNGEGAMRIAPKRRVFSRYVLPGVLVLGFAGIFGWAARDAYLPRKPVAVAPVLVSLADVQTAGTPLFKAAGWIEPRPTPICVAALAGGVVEALLVVEDQAVQKGEPIARLVDADARLALEQVQAAERLRQAEVAQARAALTAAQTNFDVPAHLELPVAEADADLAVVQTELTNLPNQLARAEARLRLAKIDLDSKEAARNSLPGIVLERAQSEYDAGQAEVNEYKQRRPVLEQQRDAALRRRDAAAKRLELKTDERQALATAQAALAAADARLREAQVAVAVAELRLERMTITAPVAGRVLDLVAMPGVQLLPGAALSPVAGASPPDGKDSITVVTMYEPERLQVRVDVRFEDLPRVGRDQPVLISSPAVKEPLRGNVLFLTGFANIQKNTLEVKVSLDDPPPVLKPEMLVDVTFLAPETDAPEDASEEEYHLFVPRPLVQTGETGTYVWVADIAQGIARRVSVTTGGVETPALIEVTQGLTAASRLITSGHESLHEGDRIEVTGEDTVSGERSTDNPVRESAHAGH